MPPNDKFYTLGRGRAWAGGPGWANRCHAWLPRPSAWVLR